MNESKRAIVFSSLGIISVLLGAWIIKTYGFDIHSGGVVIGLLALLVNLIILPVIFLKKSLAVIENTLGQKNTRIRRISVVMTTILIGILILMVLGFLWTIVKQMFW